MNGETAGGPSGRNVSRREILRTQPNGEEARGTTSVAIAIGTGQNVRRIGTVSSEKGRVVSIPENREIRGILENRGIRGSRGSRGSRVSPGKRGNRGSQDGATTGAEGGMRRETKGDIRTIETTRMSDHPSEDDEGS